MHHLLMILIVWIKFKFEEFIFGKVLHELLGDLVGRDAHHELGQLGGAILHDEGLVSEEDPGQLLGVESAQAGWVGLGCTQWLRLAVDLIGVAVHFLSIN